MGYYDIEVSTGYKMRFQVEADNGIEARAIMQEAYEEHPDEIYDLVMNYGDVETVIGDVSENDKWDGANEVLPGICY